MFPNLPVELQERIRDSLDVCDRVRLMMALPKALSKTLRRNPQTEKTLGVLARAIRKKRLTGLTIKTRNFLGRKASRQDPTVALMAATIPEVMQAAAAPEVLDHRLFRQNNSSAVLQCMQYNAPLLAALVSMSMAVRQTVIDMFAYMVYDLPRLKSIVSLLSPVPQALLLKAYTRAVGELYTESALYLEGLLLQ